MTLLREGQPINIHNPGFGVSEAELRWLLELGFGFVSNNSIEQTEKILKLKKGV